jgi:hypothetical protein
MTALFIFFIGTLVALEDWFDSKFRVDMEVGNLMDNRRFMYGNVIDRGRCVGRYVSIRLPSWAWQETFTRPGFFCWHQRHLIRNIHGEWHVHLIPEYT